MKVLLIGASGFLGRTVSYKLKQSGAEVLGTYHSNAKDDFVRLDILDVKSLIALYRAFQPDVVVWTLMNLELEEEIAEAVMPVFCETIGMTRFVFLSTSVAYEKNMSEDVVPMLRSGDMYHPKYFNGKIKSEWIIQTTGNYYASGLCGIRCAFVLYGYGAKQRRFDCYHVLYGGRQ